MSYTYLIGILLVTAVAAWGAPRDAVAAPSADGFEPLAEISLEDGPWSGALEPEEGPARDGKPTVALRWRVAQRPIPDSPPLLADWTNVAAVRFWLHLDKPVEWKLNVLLTGSPGGYFMTTIPLDFTGWRQFTLPIEQFERVRQAELSQTRCLAFRAQGYKQPLLSDDMVWWVDGVEARPKPGTTLPRLASGLAANREGWEALADKGNPYLLLNTRRYAEPMRPFQPPFDMRNAWQYRAVAEQLVPLAYAVADSASPLRGRKDLLEHALALTDWLVSQCSEEGWWWRKRPPEGDPNINRFTLGPLLDGIRWLRLLPEGEAAWPRWRDRLDKAVDLQRRAYRLDEQWDWGGLAAGLYANQDVYYALILALSAELYDRPADRRLAEEMMRKVAQNLLPDGGIRYIGVENEAPIYHALDLIIIGRYATLTRDPVAIKLLKDTADYWPLVLTAEGQPEYWSDVWWKQTWGYVWREALVVAAGATGDARNRWLMWRALERATPNGAGMGGIYAAPYWPGKASGQPLPERFVCPDRNMRGIRGREGQWYFGVTQGRGVRNTFTGGLITSPTHTHPLLAAFRGAQIHVVQDARRPHGQWWLSEIKDRTALALRPEVGGGLGARYTLQPARINGVPTPETPATPWQVTQVWRAARDGSLGMVVLEATDDVPAAAISGRLALGPRSVKGEGDGVWRSGPLRVKLLQQFGTVAPAPVSGYNIPREQGWPGLEMLQPLAKGAKKGDRFAYAVWVGPEQMVPPVACDILPGDTGWVARWPDGRCVAALYNHAAEAVTVRVPWSGATPSAWSGEQGIRRALHREGAVVTVRLEPGECALVE